MKQAISIDQCYANQGNSWPGKCHFVNDESESKICELGSR